MRGAAGLILALWALATGALADVYEMRTGNCSTAVRYQLLSDGLKREVVKDGTPCLMDQAQARQDYGKRFVTGGTDAADRYVLAIQNGDYQFTGGRPLPEQVDTPLRALAFGLLELAAQNSYSMTDDATMDEHIASIRNLVGRQISANDAQTGRAQAVAEALAQAIQSTNVDLAAQTDASADQVAARLAQLMEELQALPVPNPEPLEPRPSLPTNDADVGPILSEITGRPTVNDWSMRAQRADDRIRRAPPGPARNQALEALGYARDEIEKRPELAEALLEYAQAQRFVAEGKLPAEAGAPSSLVRDYVGYRRADTVFASKSSALDARIAALPAGGDEAEQAKNSQALAREVAAQSQALSQSGAFVDATDYLAIGTQILDIGLGFVPIVSSGKDFYELVFGVNPVTGEELSTTDRVLAGVGLFSGGLINSKVTKAIAKGVKRFGGANTLARVNALIDQGDDLMRQAVKIGFQKPKVVKDLFVRPIGKAWGRLRAGLVYIDGDARKVFQATPPSVDMLPKNGVYARYMKRTHAENFRNGTGSLGKPGDASTLITAYHDVREFDTHAGMARRLWLRNQGDTAFLDTKADDWVLVRFKMKGSVWDTLSTPTAPNGLENVPGWIPGGRTQGGASEFLISNGTSGQLDSIVDQSSIVIDDIFVD